MNFKEAVAAGDPKPEPVQRKRDVFFDLQVATEFAKQNNRTVIYLGMDKKFKVRPDGSMKECKYNSAPRSVGFYD